MSSKQEAIQKAYEELGIWEEVKNYIDENGWLHTDDYYLISNGFNFNQIECNHEKDTLLFDKHRPISLRGLENNHGWIKIESEKDLPKINKRIHIMLNGFSRPYIGKLLPGGYCRIEKYDLKLTDKITHWKELPKPPIY